MIKLENIHKTYQLGKIEVKALQGVSLEIRPAEFVAIMGPSGSGKSTLMHIIGLLDRPDSGEYHLQGRKIAAFTDEKLAKLRNKLIGFIFQQFHLLPRMNVLENVELPLIYAGKRELRKKAEEKISEVGLRERILHRPNELSGGQQQRVAIARALVNEPAIILADEPTGNLDTKSMEEILSILKELNRRGKTVVVVTHENEVAVHAKRTILMRDGRIISDTCKDAAVNACGEITENYAAFSEEEHKVGKAEFSDFLREGLSAMWSHKARSFLSVLGILIGVAAVIAMLALGEGAKEFIQTRLVSLGSNLLIVRPGSAMVHGVALESGAVTRFTFEDLAAIGKVSQVRRLSPSVVSRGQVIYADKNWNTQIEGAGFEYEEIRNASPFYGRFFTEEEEKSREKTAVIGTTVAKELFGDVLPVGETIKINLINFRVIGVLPEKGSAGFRDQDDTVVIPVTTAMYRLMGKQYIDSIYVEVKDAGLVDEAVEEVRNAIMKQHRLTSEQADSFQIRNMADIRNALEATTKTMSLLLGSISAISLLVGGIGIMNIMLVSVTERTREIGLRKAIGAANADILIQFLIEAVMMAFIGGTFGIMLGAGTAYLITFFAGWTVKISAFSIILATVFSFVIGVVFGLWPARQASRLDPIEALRYE